MNNDHSIGLKRLIPSRAVKEPIQFLDLKRKNECLNQ